MPFEERTTKRRPQVGVPGVPRDDRTSVARAALLSIFITLMIASGGCGQSAGRNGTDSTTASPRVPAPQSSSLATGPEPAGDALNPLLRHDAPPDGVPALLDVPQGANGGPDPCPPSNSQDPQITILLDTLEEFQESDTGEIGRTTHVCLAGFPVGPGTAQLTMPSGKVARIPMGTPVDVDEWGWDMSITVRPDDVVEVDHSDTGASDVVGSTDGQEVGTYRLTVTKDGETATSSWKVRRSSRPLLADLNPRPPPGEPVAAAAGQILRFGAVGVPPQSNLRLGLYREHGPEYRFAALIPILKTADPNGEVLFEIPVPQDPIPAPPGSDESCFLLVLDPTQPHIFAHWSSSYFCVR